MGATLHQINYKILVTSLTGTTSSQDSIFIIFPTGSVPGTYSPGTIAPASGPNGPVSVVGGLRYSFGIPAGLGAAGDTIKFSYTYALDPAYGGGCTTTFPFDIFTTVNNSAVCNAVTCTIANITGAGTGNVVRIDTVPPVPDFIPLSDTVSCISDVPPIANLTGTDQCPGKVNVSVLLPRIAPARVIY